MASPSLKKLQSSAVNSEGVADGSGSRGALDDPTAGGPSLDVVMAGALVE
jgi:hypothetical protein